MDERVLVVDDNPVNLKLMCRLLEKEGYAVEWAGDAEKARETILRFDPQLILMDIGLPGMDGFTFTSQLKADEKTRNILILAVTAYAMKGDEQRALQAGCDGYVSKPVDTRKLPAQIAELLKKKLKERAIG